MLNKEQNNLISPCGSGIDKIIECGISLYNIYSLLVTSVLRIVTQPAVSQHCST